MGTSAVAVTVACALAVAWAVGVDEVLSGVEEFAAAVSEPPAVAAAEPWRLEAVASPRPSAVPDAELPLPVAEASTEFEELADTLGGPSSPTMAAASVSLLALAAAVPLSPTV